MGRESSESGRGVERSELEARSWGLRVGGSGVLDRGVGAPGSAVDGSTSSSQSVLRRRNEGSVVRRRRDVERDESTSRRADESCASVRVRSPSRARHFFAWSRAIARALPFSLLYSLLFSYHPPSASLPAFHLPFSSLFFSSLRFASLSCRVRIEFPRDLPNFEFALADPGYHIVLVSFNWRRVIQRIRRQLPLTDLEAAWSSGTDQGAPLPGGGLGEKR
ncbi:uncharacterized protein LOC143211740 isoform X3 [Lasioglossum baleicum]|uniref:uncharacterized protein LOC143211740 isoform X3 n=1 Tax=Lasioglossum baleicum TaxID=434251 RepID=UPI003FCEB069